MTKVTPQVPALAGMTPLGFTPITPQETPAMTTTTTLTIAQQIANALDNDGMQFSTRPTDGSEPQDFMDLILRHGGSDHYWPDGWKTGDAHRHTFNDGSIITVAGDAWDFGFATCFCWAGCPNDDCTAQHDAGEV